MKEKGEKKMKKTKIMTAAVALCMAAAVFAGCSSEPASGETAVATRIEGGQTQIAIENSAADLSGAIRGYSFSHNGYEIGIGTKEDIVLAAMGEPYDIKEVDNCANQGLGKEYQYYENRVRIQIPNDSNEVTQIYIADPIIDCGGVSVGDSAETVMAVYGDTENNEYLIEYKKDGMALQFHLENGKVTTIMFLEDYLVA